MNWGSIDDFLGMHGYGLYVWGSYGLALLIFLVEPWLARQRHQRALEFAREARED